MALLGSHLIMPAVATTVTAVVGGLFYMGSVALTSPSTKSDPKLEERLKATGLITEKEPEPVAEVLSEEEILEKARLVPVHRYYNFLAPFLTNLQTGQMITLELAISTSQKPADADTFLETIEGFKPVLRSEILTYLSTVSGDRFEHPKVRRELAEEIKNVINSYLNISDKSEKIGVSQVYIQKMVVS